MFQAIARAVGAMVPAIAMGIECLINGGIGFTRRVISWEYIGGVIALAVIAIFFPGLLLVHGLVGSNWVTTSGFVVTSIIMIIVSLVGFKAKRPVLAIFPILVTTPLLGFLLFGPSEKSEKTILFAVFICFALIVLWGIAMVPAVFLIGGLAEIIQFFRETIRRPTYRPIPTPASVPPAPTPTKKK